MTSMDKIKNTLAEIPKDVTDDFVSAVGIALVSVFLTKKLKKAGEDGDTSMAVVWGARLVAYHLAQSRVQAQRYRRSDEKKDKLSVK